MEFAQINIPLGIAFLKLISYFNLLVAGMNLQNWNGLTFLEYQIVRYDSSKPIGNIHPPSLSDFHWKI